MDKKINGSFMFGSTIFLLMLVMLIINISFAWYTARVNQGNIELFSEGIEITLDNNPITGLKPVVLKEGVIAVDSDNNYISPSDYYVCDTCDNSYSLDTKASHTGCEGLLTINSIYVMENEVGNTVTSTNNTVDLYLDSEVGTKVSIFYTIKYKDATGELVELTESEVEEYFNITVSFYNSNSELVEVGNLVTGTYNMTVTVGYAVSDELLPFGLVNAKAITLTVIGVLTNN